MGNQLVGIAPSQIFPVERYLTDYPELKFDASMGSTRFFKVARAVSQEGLVVVKVFAIHDPSLPLATYRDQLEVIRKRLSNTVNCLPFQKIILTDKAGLIIREYVKYSLYDRISTRPFLTNIEKIWITFQILYALHQCHKVGVCHGDIKLENITVTAWNWVLLVDFASFKPTFVPEDNPADYSYFFDTSRRRTCYLAPERFSKTTNTENSALITETLCDNGELTPAMDIFSAGCALLELWNELHVPFEYSQLLAYRTGNYSPQKHLDALEDPSLRAMIASMIEIDPSKRLTAEDYLARERGKLFPEYFFTFLQPYMLIFSSTPILSPDEKILRLTGDIGSIFKFLGPVRHGAHEDHEKGESEALVLIISLVASCIRGLHDCTSKLNSLEILLELADHASDETILDRILPYIMFLAKDLSSRVKIAAINTITQCVDLVRQLPRSDSNIFPEYILLGLAPLSMDPNACVRAAYARNIATLAEIALRYLDQIQNDWYDGTSTKSKFTSSTNTFNYELELQALHDMVGHTVSVLLTDSQAIVKQTLIENGIAKLCVFFGKQKANDVILSHIITFLNDKDDRQLRGSFYDCIIGVAAYIGWHCSPILTPLLLQGLTDPCEFVTAKSINAMSSLTELGLLPKTSVCELVSECCGFLVHPNLWVRHAVVGFVATTTKHLSLLDVQCKIMPLIKPYMKYSLIQIDKPELLLDSLQNPIPRSVYDGAIMFNDLPSLLSVLINRKAARSAMVAANRVPGVEMPANVKNLLKRMEANGMTEQVEEYLLKIDGHLRKLNKYKLNSGQKQNQQQQPDGKIELNSAESTIRSHVFYLGDNQKTDFIAERKLHRTNTSGSIDTNLNSDWNYSSDLLTRHSESTNSGTGLSSRSTSSRPSSPPPDPHTPFNSTEPSSNMSLHERSYIQYRRSSCYVELNKLKIRQQEHYLEAFRAKEWSEQSAWLPQLPPPEWHPRGTLVAHLHEHRSAVNRLVAIPDQPLFASCSADGYVRIWDAAKMEGRNIANRSRQHYRAPNQSNVLGMAVCDGGQSLAVTGQDGSVSILRVDPAGAKMTVIQSRQLNPDEEGFAVDLHTLDTGYQNVVVYATLYGSFVAWDLRAPGNAWRLENGLEKGFVTSFCIDSHQSLLTLGTSIGHYRAWDLRFQLPINSFDQPTSEKITRVISHPTEPSWIISSVQGNNKILMWNVETKLLEKILWGNRTPPLTQASVQGSSNSVCALLAGTIDRNPFVLSGGTDQRIRFWNLETADKSYIVAAGANDHIGSNISYESRLIDGYHVIHEHVTERLKDPAEEAPRGGPEPPPAGHRDCITDITLCKASQCFMVSSSRDGIIKVWK